ncbi:hypothetical protein SUGI_0034950 [Cryptomeria japonica]|nr:hypothetical protein SUGI_0034950 [Cryptomeria japonica]
METKFLRDKRFWFASFLITWAAALQAHMMWLRRQESFQEKFGTTKKKTQEIPNFTHTMTTPPRMSLCLFLLLWSPLPAYCCWC